MWEEKKQSKIALMKIYFSASLRAKNTYKKNFDLIHQFIEDLGYAHTSDFMIKARPEEFYNRKAEDFLGIYKNLTSQIKKADICVFEISSPSLGTGYCVDLALQTGKPVVLLYLKGSNPMFFKGIKSDRLQLYEYKIKDLREVLEDAIKTAKDSIDIRFTFFITPKIVRFLSFISKKKKIPRAVFLRQLLEESMQKEGFK